MRKIFFMFIGIILAINLFAQNCELSTEAQKYWNRAMAASDAITSDEDYQLVADEFEKALQHASHCSDVYYNLAKIYAQIGLKQGNAVFDKAESYLKSYINLESNDKDAQALADRIEFNKEKYEKDLIINQQEKKEDSWNTLRKLEGNWECNKTNFFRNFDVIINGQNAQIILKPYFENGKLEHSGGKSYLNINADNTYSFSIEGIWYHNAGNMSGGNGPYSNDFTTYLNYVGKLELTADGILKCSYYTKSTRDVDNTGRHGNRSYYHPKNDSWNNYLWIDFCYKSY